MYAHGSAAIREFYAPRDVVSLLEITQQVIVQTVGWHYDEANISCGVLDCEVVPHIPTKMSEGVLQQHGDLISR